jgi:hypothetical protein
MNYTVSLKNMDMINNILYPKYEIYDIGIYKKYKNEYFDIFCKNKSILLIKDKRDANNIVIYNDLKTAYSKIINNH